MATKKTLSNSAAPIELTDEQNPNYLFSLTHLDLLLKIANGEIDAKKLALIELANRGIGTEGKWVGVETAEVQWQLNPNCRYFVKDRFGGIKYFSTNEEMVAYFSKTKHSISMGETKHLTK